MRLEEALPADARATEEVFGNARVWLTDRWMYLVDEGTGKVLNVVRRATR